MMCSAETEKFQHNFITAVLYNYYDITFCILNCELPILGFYRERHKTKEVPGIGHASY